MKARVLFPIMQVRVEDVGKAIVVGLLNENVQGVQRYMQIESLAAEIPIDEP